jgi:hypothetical protein
LSLFACAEIGDATVGSLASCTSKDSSLQAPGYFSALLASVTYVDHRGEARMRFVLALCAQLLPHCLACAQPCLANLLSLFAV